MWCVFFVVANLVSWEVLWDLPNFSNKRFVSSNHHKLTLMHQFIHNWHIMIRKTCPKSPLVFAKCWLWPIMQLIKRDQTMALNTMLLFTYLQKYWAKIFNLIKILSFYFIIYLQFFDIVLYLMTDFPCFQN